MHIPNIYLAGPDVFGKESTIVFRHLKALCAKHGLQGLSPFDGEACLDGPGDEVAKSIYDANVALIRQCDGVLANVAPFRNGMEPDSGTLFEIGFAVAMEKPVAAYNVFGLLEDRITAECGAELIDGRPFDLRYGYQIESFGQGLNLMISRSASLHAAAEDAIAELATKLRKPTLYLVS